MPEHPEWRIERYQDEMDPFANIQWYVMQGNVVLATCEVEAHAESILVEHSRRVVYEQVLQHISGMTASSHDLAAAIEAAFRALNRDD